MTRHNLIRNTLFLIISVALVAILLSRVKIVDIKKALSNIRPMFILLGFCFHLLLQFVRILLLKRLISSKKIDSGSLFKISTVHAMMNKLLPARTGEISYIFLLKKEKIGLGESTATLMVMRILELIILLFAFLTSLVLLKARIAYNALGAYYALSFVSVLLLIFLSLLLVLHGRFLIFLERILDRGRISNNRLAVFLGRKSKEFRESMRVVHYRKYGISISMYTILITLLLYLSLYCLFLGLNIRLRPDELVFIVSIPWFIESLPIHSFGGFGTTEGGYTLAFIMLGKPMEFGIISGFNIHVITFLFTISMGLWGTVLLLRGSKN